MYEKMFVKNKDTIVTRGATSGILVLAVIVYSLAAKGHLRSTWWISSQRSNDPLYSLIPSSLASMSALLDVMFSSACLKFSHLTMSSTMATI